MATFGGGGVKRYAETLTPLNPEGQPDGMSLSWGDWYRPPVRSTPYVAGKREGVETIYFGGGSTQAQATITWVADEIHGPKKTYYQNGTLASESNYEHGVVTGESKSYGKDGALLRVATFKDGKRHGVVRDYWPDRPDLVKREITYRMGEVHGLAREYYSNGQVKWEQPFVDNKQHGIETHYEADGTVNKTKYWLAGDEVDEAAYLAAVK
jgi:antitoxin component YwqK of YwqJK toxin-antitoxin module